jgi:hypothetical protein
MSLNTQLINSEIAIDHYRKHVAMLLSGMCHDERTQFDNIIFS